MQKLTDPPLLVQIESIVATTDVPSPRSGGGTTVFSSRRSASLWQSPHAAPVPAPDDERPRERMHWIIEATSTQQAKHWMEVHTEENAPPMHLLWTATPLIANDGVCVGCLVDAADVTNLVGMYGELEARYGKLEMFSHSVAHTLKTDWQGVSLLVDELSALVEESKDGELPLQDIESLLAELGPRAQKGVQTVRDLLAYATATRRPDFEYVPLRDIVESVAKRVGSPTIEIADDVPATNLRLDTETFPIALLQLIENAVKYGQGKPVNISFSDEKLRIQDHGRGIPTASLEEVFGVFKRLATDVSGTGLGLAIAKQIIEIHGYRVWAESNGPGTGAAFIIDFGPK